MGESFESVCSGNVVVVEAGAGSVVVVVVVVVVVAAISVGRGGELGDVNVVFSTTPSMLFVTRKKSLIPFLRF